MWCDSDPLRHSAANFEPYRKGSLMTSYRRPTSLALLALLVTLSGCSARRLQEGAAAQDIEQAGSDLRPLSA